ncbi:ABC transporter ATP-binding protein [Patulibacter sp. SYSU D01012]|uniref:ABC transporter ATP-binding protein n=1 Tax=Patulibacter sp. SYSU D01012 TaxID=2817381 RepID=UPI001B317A3A
MSSPAIVVDGVRKSFRRPHHQTHTLKERALHPFRRVGHDEFTAVDDVSFSVEEGEFFGIVGRNGSGKSTLLKMLAGIYGADAGDIWLRGRLSTFIELGVGFNPDLGARDNVMLNAIMLGLTPSVARSRYDAVIDFAELRDFEDVKLKNYSSGMHVRLAFSVMIQVDADVLLIDEVLAVGDAAFQQKCFDQFNRLRDEGRTMVLVTHDMGAVKRFCDRAMLMERGRVVEQGDPERVGANYLAVNFSEDREASAASIGAGAVDLNRQGDGRARVERMTVEDDRGEPRLLIQRGETVVVRFELQFVEDMLEPSVGLVVEDDQHRPVFSGNSIWVQRPVGNFRAGDRAEAIVRFENVFASGRYTVTPYVASRGAADLEFADRRKDFGSFVSAGPNDTGAITVLDHDVEVRALGHDRPAALPATEVRS